MIVSTINVLNGPTIIVISPDGSLAYVAEQYANAVSVVDLATGTDTADISVGEHPIGLAITPDGTQVYVADQFSNSVSVIDTSTYTVVNTIPITTGNASGPIFLAVTPDGSRVYVGTNDNLPAGVAGTTVNIIDTSTQTVVNSLTTQQGPLGVAISGDGQQAFVTKLFFEFVVHRGHRQQHCRCDSRRRSESA